MRPWIAASIAAALAAAWGCSSPYKTAEREAQPPAPVAPGRTAGTEGEEILKKLKADPEAGDQAKPSQADGHYRLAERYYQAGEFDKAELEGEKAVRINPDYAAARALLTEVRFIMGKGVATPESVEYEKYMKKSLVGRQQTLVEIDNAHALGSRHYNGGEYDSAEREFRKILEFARWMPEGVELETRRRQALDMLERTRKSRASRNVEEEKARLKMIEEQGAAPKK